MTIRLQVKSLRRGQKVRLVLSPEARARYFGSPLARLAIGPAFTSEKSVRINESSRLVLGPAVSLAEKFFGVEGAKAFGSRWRRR